MTPDFAGAARRLVASPSDDVTSRAIADRAVEAYDRLSRHLARVIGETGVRTLFARSVRLASASNPWLAGAVAGVKGKGELEGARVLREAMESQDPEPAAAAFVDVLSTFVNLLERLIGERLVSRLLHEVWPTLFPSA